MSALQRWALRALAVVAMGSIVPACKSNGTAQNVVNVVAIFCEGGQAPFPRSTIIYVDFDQPLNPATVTAANFQVVQVGGGVWPNVQSPTYNAVRQEVAIYPLTLASGTLGVQTYVVNVSPSVMDTNGDPCTGAQMGFEVVVTTDADAPVFGGGTGISAGQGALAGDINLSWNAATDATGPITYYIYGSTVLGGEDFGAPVTSISAPVLSITVSGLMTGTTYYFVVRARDGAGNEDENTTQSAGVAAP